MILSYVPIFNIETASFLKVLDTLVDNGEKDLRHLLEGLTLNIASR